MEYALFASVLLILYLVRDSELLRIRCHGRPGIRIAVYACTTGIAVIVAGLLAGASDLPTFLREIRSPGAVKALLAIQLSIWFYYAWLRRTVNLSRLWTVAVVPSPVLVLCLSGLTFVVPPFMGLPFVVRAVLVTAIWITSVTFWMRWSMSFRNDVAWGLSFASMSNALIVLLLPIEDIFAQLENVFRMILAHD